MVDFDCAKPVMTHTANKASKQADLNMTGIIVAASNVGSESLTLSGVLVAPTGLEPGLSALKGPRVNQLHNIEEVESYAALRNGEIGLRFSLIALDSS